MGYYRDSDFYNEVFGEKVKYHVHWSESEYLPLWQKIIDHLLTIDPGRILEVGCGTGQFAAMLKHHGFTDYIGFDFSETAVELANKASDQEFYLGDARKIQAYKSQYNTVITLEVLEHTEDLEILKNLRSGSEIIFSVPDFDDRAHLRHFSSIDEVRSRYQDAMIIEDITYFDRYFIVIGSKE